MWLSRVVSCWERRWERCCDRRKFRCPWMRRRNGGAMSWWLRLANGLWWLRPRLGGGAKQWPAERYGAVAVELEKAGFRTLVNASST